MNTEAMTPNDWNNLTPEELACIEDLELQEAENEAFWDGWNDPKHDK